MKALGCFRIFPVLTACLVILQASDDVIRQEGDVMLASLFDVNEARSDGTCGAFDLQQVHDAYAVQWFVRQLNQQNYIPGVTIGLDSRRTCFSHARTLQSVFRLIDSYVTNSSYQDVLAGIVGPVRSEAAVSVSELFSSLPENQQVLQISGSATGVALANKDNYPNFFRVIPPDGSQVEVITELLLDLRWNYIAIVFTDEEYGRSAAAALLQEVKQHSICVPVYASVPVDTTSLEFTNAVDGIAENMKGKASAGISSVVLGLVFIGGKKQAQQFAIQLDNLATFVEIIFSEALGLQTSAMRKENQDTIIGVAKGALTVTPQYRAVEEFRQAWNELWNNCSHPPAEVTDNQWLRGLKDQFSADCTQLQLGEREQMLFTWYQVQAAAMFAAALRSLQSSACGQVPGPCPAFLGQVKDHEQVRRLWRTGLNLDAEFGDMVASFKGMTNVSFDDRGEVVINSSRALYEVHNFRSCLDDSGEFCFVKVGSNAGGTVSLTQTLMLGYDSSGLPRPWRQMDPAQCGADKDCPECVSRTCDFALLVPGDFYFVAVAPVHSRDPDDAFECGNSRGSLGADFVQAIQFALGEVNKERGRWSREMPGKTLGAIILDSCYSPLVMKYKLLQLHQGHIMTPSGPLDETYVKDVLLKRIAGYIGGYFSVISFAMSDVLTKLDRKAYVHVSPTSVAEGLSDREQHPYFMRLVVSAHIQILAMMDLLTKLSATFVQIIYDPVDAYSVDLTKGFENEAGKHGVCVAQKIEATLESDPTLYSRILGQLRQKSSARMVIVILQYEQILQVMDYLIGDGTHLQRQDNFVFLGSETWGRKPKIIQGKHRLAGSLSIAEEIAVDSRFTDYFRQLDPLNTNNFWLREYWEARGNCYFDLSFQRKGKSGECAADIQETYSQDPWVSYYIQTVYAFASGVGAALRDTCPRSAENICSALTASTLVEHMKQVKLDLFSQGRELTVFDTNGDGENGYKLMQAYWDPDSSAMTYRQIGTWTQGGRLSLSVSVADLYTELPADIALRNYNSSCSSESECLICPSSERHSDTKDDEKTMPFITAVVVIAALGVLVLILFVAVIVCCCRRAQKRTDNAMSEPGIKFKNAPASQSSLSYVTSRQPVQEEVVRDPQGTGGADPGHRGTVASGQYDTLFAAASYSPSTGSPNDSGSGRVAGPPPHRPDPPVAHFFTKKNYLTAI